MVKILIGCTGSVATIKLPLLVDSILKDVFKAEVRGRNIFVFVKVTELFFSCRLGFV